MFGINKFNVSYKDVDYCASDMKVLDEGGGWKVFSYSGNMNELSKAKNGEKLYSWMWGYGKWVYDEAEEAGEYTLTHWQCDDYHIVSTKLNSTESAELYEALFYCTGDHSEVYRPLGGAVGFADETNKDFYMFFKNYGVLLTLNGCEKGWNTKCYEALRKVLGLE